VKNKSSLTGSPAVLKHINRVRLLGILFRDKMASRAQLARKTGLDAKTITNICNSLLEDNLIICGDIEIAGRGRPAENLMLNSKTAYAFGVDIGALQVTTILVDFKGDVHWQCKHKFEATKNKDYILKIVKQSIAAGLDSLDKSQHDKIKGIGICLPGFLNREEGIVLRSVNIPSSNNIAICSLLEKWFGFPAVIEESSRAMTLGEMWFGDKEYKNDFICIDLGYGIGMGIVHNGQLYRGANEASGELGHMIVDSDGIECTCGKRGCLETLASGRALADFVNELQLKDDVYTSKGAMKLYEAALAGNSQACKTIERAGMYIGMAVANVINLFDPGAVIVNGGLTGAGDLLMDPLQKSIKEHAIEYLGKGCRVEISQVGLAAGALGAAMLPLKNYFEFEDIRF
jgi:N-acetylglucosamine repressor